MRYAKRLALFILPALASFWALHLSLALEIVTLGPSSGELQRFLLMLCLLPIYPWHLAWSTLASVEAMRGKRVTSLMSLSLSILTLVTIVSDKGLEPVQSNNQACKLRIVSLNLDAYMSDLATVSKALKKLEPDILLVQEIWRPQHAKFLSESSLPRHVAGDLKEGPVPLGPGLCIFTNLSTDGPSLKLGEKLLAQEIILPNGRSLLVATLHGVKVDAGVKTLLSIESYSESVRLQQKQMLDLAEAIENFSGAVLIAGDFNAPPTAPWLKPLLRRLEDSHRGSKGEPLGFTFPSDYPLVRLDRVYISKSSAQVLTHFTLHVGSDHKAVVTDLLY